MVERRRKYLDIFNDIAKYIFKFCAMARFLKSTNFQDRKFSESLVMLPNPTKSTPYKVSKYK